MDTMKELIQCNSKGDGDVLTSVHLWEDKKFEKYADATLIMGDRTWKVHRWVLCSQSKYFDKALEGSFMESAEKKIDLTGNPFTEDEVHHLLVFMYTTKDEYFKELDVLEVYALADYFQVDRLRYRALKCIYGLFERMARCHLWQNFGTNALQVLEKYPSGDIQKVLVEVIAKNIPSIMYDNGSTIWKQLKAAQPNLVEQVLKVRFPKNAQSLQESDLLPPSERAAARAAQAFDDISPSPSRSGGSRRHRASVRVLSRFLYRSAPY